ncbi:MAG: FAD:protein FMN transferase [Lachnospiraceae bacterium]|nr:FAD:protein FMN transferase [Lachnospiraceae bacterium]
MGIYDSVSNVIRHFGCRLGAASLLGVLVLALTGCGAFPAPGYSEKTGAEVMMDTYMTFSIKARPGENADSLYDSIVDKGRFLEKDLISGYIEGSELSRINESAGKAEGYPLSGEMEEYLTDCLEISEKSGGAFDISLGALIELWNLEDAIKNETRDYIPPADEEISDCLKSCGYEKIRIEDHRIFIPEGMRLELGAVGKGILLDSAGEEVSKISSGILAAGGSIRTIGYKPGGGKWNIAVRDPFDTGEIAESVGLLGDYFVSTSGDYERFIKADDKKYHHIFDPKTGYPADSGLTSVTVVMKAEEGSGLLSDALSTAIFVLGENEGRVLANEYGVYVIMIRDDGKIVRYGELR